MIKCATRRGWQVYGIPYGTQGLIDLEQGDCSIQELQLHDHGFDIPGLRQGVDILQFLSGSILGALNKGDPSDPQIAREILDGYRLLGLDALIALGGDGSLDIINDLAQKGGWNWIAIPKTIDNDVPFTERSLGFDTAVDTVTRALYDLTFTAASHSRIIVVQVMGRDAGHLALQAGIASGADVILIPELAPQLNDSVLDGICQQIVRLRQCDRQFALVVVAKACVASPALERNTLATPWRSRFSNMASSSARAAPPNFARSNCSNREQQRWATFSAAASPLHLIVSSPLPSAKKRLN